MNQSNRNCTIVGHQEEYVSFLCSLNECEGSRWLCPSCLVDETHRHGRNNNKHLKNKKQMLDQFEEKLKEIKNNQSQQRGKVLQNLQRMNSQVQVFMKVVKDLQAELLKVLRDYEENGLNQEIQNLLNRMRENYFNLNNDEINKILSFNPNEIEKNININYIQYILDQFPQIFKNLSQDFLQFQQSYLEPNNSIKNYELKSIEQENNIQNRKIFTFVQISPNEQYIAIADNLGSLTLNNSASNKQIARATLEKCVYQCKFSEDSQHLFVACKGGYLYKLNQELQIINSYKTNQEVIQSLEIISDSIILTSSNQTIVKSDINNKKQLLKITQGSVNVKYDSLNNMIIGEFYNIIYFWNQEGQNIISKQNAHDLRIIQIQIIQESQQLLSLDEEGILKMWLINLNTKDLILLNSIQDLNNRMMSFYSIQNDMRIILYYEQGVYIVNQKMQNQKILHKFTRIINYSNNLNIKQSKSAKYIPILTEDYIHILKVQQ